MQSTQRRHQAINTKHTPRIPVKLFDYKYPKELVAKYPAQKRGYSRLLVVDASKKQIIAHKRYYHIPEYLNPGDVVVINNVKVINARLIGTVPTTNKPIEVFLVSPLKPGQIHDNLWYALLGPAKRIKKHKRIVFSKKFYADVKKQLPDGRFLLEFNGSVIQITQELGQIPIPKYIKRQANSKDSQRYQTIAAKVPGAIAAPTASLNLTPKIIDKIRAKGAQIAYITLFVGWATFAPLRNAEYLDEFDMPGEYVVVSKKTASLINETLRANKKVLAFGTTATRTIEGVATKLGRVQQYEGIVDLFITPGYKFKVVNHIVTNFHPPLTTPLVLVSSILGISKTKQIYKTAFAKGYKLFSYGDSMLLLNVS